MYMYVCIRFYLVAPPTDHTSLNWRMIAECAAILYTYSYFIVYYHSDVFNKLTNNYLPRVKHHFLWQILGMSTTSIIRSMKYYDVPINTGYVTIKRVRHWCEIESIFFSTDRLSTNGRFKLIIKKTSQ